MRHLRLCQELIERGMHLARIAADRAEQESLAPPPAPMPGSSAAAIEQAEARARLRVPNHAATFARLSRAVRQTIALQAHIKAGRPFAHPQHPPHTGPNAAPHTPAQPRDRTECRLDAADPPDWLLPTGPDGRIPVETLLQSISNNFGADLPTAETPTTPAAVNPAPTHPSSHEPPPPKTALRPPHTIRRRW